MRDLTPVQLAYFAGFFDGEGSITSSGEKGYRRWVLRCSVGQVDPRPLLKLQKAFGGQLRKVKKPPHQDQWHWTVCSQMAKGLLEALQPYLIVKREQAKVGLKLQGRMKHQGGNKGLPDGEWKIRNALARKLKRLKRYKK